MLGIHTWRGTLFVSVLFPLLELLVFLRISGTLFNFYSLSLVFVPSAELSGSRLNPFTAGWYAYLLLCVAIC